ncbi:UBP1-associated protein 2C-like protein [Tanacetum coccineum]|uniref:UBP1-associated protein 2C-like protein n=1 Tax=Tanacetum coccineum TaxID=301880 RepID=A0ABQ5J3E0_9ASTR
MRKIYVGNAPFEISSERLLAHFVTYKEIEEGPLGFDKQSGKVKGFAFFVYKSEEGARNSLVDPIKVARNRNGSRGLLIHNPLQWFLLHAISFHAEDMCYQLGVSTAIR